MTKAHLARKPGKRVGTVHRKHRVAESPEQVPMRREQWESKSPKQGTSQGKGEAMTDQFMPRVTFVEAQDAWDTYIALAEATCQAGKDVQTAGYTAYSIAKHKRLNVLTSAAWDEYERLASSKDTYEGSNWHGAH